MTKRELVQRVVASAHFSKSERLSSFLLHICEFEMQGRAAELSEKEIGQSVFHLPIDYDPSIDGIVRSHASRLRRKLEMYYMREGRDENIRIVIPRGGYQPRFESVECNSAEVQTGQPEALSLKEDDIGAASSPFAVSRLEEPSEDVGLSDSHDIKSSGILQWRIAAVFVIIVGFVVTALLYQHFRAANSTAPSPLASMFTKERATILVPGDSGVVVWQEAQHKNLTLSDYLAANYAQNQGGPITPEQQVALALLGRRYTSMVDLEIVQKSTNIARTYNAELLLRYARDVRPSDLKHNNVILIGSSETNPWNQMFQETMNFVLNKDQQRTLYTIENRHPISGEPARWLSDPAERLHTAYCKVSYLANPSGEGHVLVLEGTSMAGTECAWEFIANHEKLKQFLKLAGWTGRQSPHFEALLRTSNLGGDAATSTIVAWRISK